MMASTTPNSNIALWVAGVHIEIYGECTSIGNSDQAPLVATYTCSYQVLDHLLAAWFVVDTESIICDYG